MIATVKYFRPLVLENAYKNNNKPIVAENYIAINLLLQTEYLKNNYFISYL